MLAVAGRTERNETKLATAGKARFALKFLRAANWKTKFSPSVFEAKCEIPHKSVSLLLRNFSPKEQSLLLLFLFFFLPSPFALYFAPGASILHSAPRLARLPSPSRLLFFQRQVNFMGSHRRASNHPTNFLRDFPLEQVTSTRALRTVRNLLFNRRNFVACSPAFPKSESSPKLNFRRIAIATGKGNFLFHFLPVEKFVTYLGTVCTRAYRAQISYPNFTILESEGGWNRRGDLPLAAVACLLCVDVRATPPQDFSTGCIKS